MNKELSQVELKNIILNKTMLPPDVIDAFVDQFFKEVKNCIVNDSYLKLEGLGLFRVIQSGDSSRILYLGSKESIENSLDVVAFKDELEKLLPDNIAIEEKEKEIDQSQNAQVVFSTVPENKVGISNYGGCTTVSKESYLPIKKRKLNLIKTSIFAVISLLIIVVATILIGNSNNDAGNEVKTDIDTANFIELANLDTLNFSYIVIPKSDVSLQYVSEIYYGKEDFWPYIYFANEDFVGEHLTIQTGVIVKIPKKMINLVEYNNGMAISEARRLGDQIRERKNIK